MQMLIVWLPLTVCRSRLLLRSKLKQTSCTTDRHMLANQPTLPPEPPVTSRSCRPPRLCPPHLCCLCLGLSPYAGTISLCLKEHQLLLCCLNLRTGLRQHSTTQHSSTHGATQLVSLVLTQGWFHVAAMVMALLRHEVDASRFAGQTLHRPYQDAETLPIQ